MEPESPTTGSLQPISSPLRKTRDSMRSARPTGSGTTGGAPPARTPRNSIGMPPSATGVAVRPATADERLKLFDLPGETITCLSDSLKSRVAVETKSLFDAGGQFAGAGLGPFRIRAGMTVEEARCDLAALSEACRPGQRAKIAHEVAKLVVRTKQRVQGEGEGALLVEVMVEDLGAYPLDVVQFACGYWVDGGREAKFFPSWPELKEICDRRMSGRYRLRRALEHVLESSHG